MKSDKPTFESTIRLDLSGEVNIPFDAIVAYGDGWVKTDTNDLYFVSQKSLQIRELIKSRTKEFDQMIEDQEGNNGEF